MEFPPDAAASALARLPRTRAMVNEAPRHYLPTFTLVREVIGRDRAGETEIVRGAAVMINLWVLHRGRRRWHDATSVTRTDRLLR